MLRLEYGGFGAGGRDVVRVDVGEVAGRRAQPGPQPRRRVRREPLLHVLQRRLEHPHHAQLQATNAGTPATAPPATPSLPLPSPPAYRQSVVWICATSVFRVGTG